MTTIDVGAVVMLCRYYVVTSTDVGCTKGTVVGRVNEEKRKLKPGYSFKVVAINK